jgi:sugar fermentation stimulation protein A
MKFATPLLEGVLIKRYKRFLADVKLATGEAVVAHCANPGSMLSVNEPGARVWLSPAQNPDRKLKYTWEIIEVNKTLIGINTAHPNKIVANAIADGKIKELTGYVSLRREKKYGKNSRIDILLMDDGKPPCYVEVKNVTMKRGKSLKDPAEFPDSVTARGAKHLVEMTDMVKEGARAVMVYLVQRDDCKSFTIASDIDPNYAKGLKAALAAGVEAVCYGCEVRPDRVTIAGPLRLILPN